MKVERCHVSCTTQEDFLAAYEGTDMGDLIHNFMALTAKVETLRNFVMLNLQAVIKITKKHDKHSDINLQSDVVQQVHNRDFFKSQLFGTLILDIEALAMELMLRLAGDASDINRGVSYDSQCPTCMQQLCNPIMLPCGHRFCMRCVSPASYFKKGYRCPVCQQEHTLDVETVKYGPLLSPGSLPLRASMSHWQQLSTSAPGAPINTRPALHNQHDSAQETEDAHEIGTSQAKHKHTPYVSALARKTADSEKIDFVKLERQISKRLLARERYHRKREEASPLADLSQVFNEWPCPCCRTLSAELLCTPSS
jgi:hypothetical protein